MAHYKGSIDLLKLTKAGITEIRGKRCVVIPIEENDIFTPDRGGAFLTLTYWEKDTPDSYGKTHSGSQSYSKAFREANGNVKAPILGSLAPFEWSGNASKPKAEETPSEAPKTAPKTNVGASDLPF